MELDYSVCASPFGFLRRNVIQNERKRRGDTPRVFTRARASASDLKAQSMTWCCGLFAFYFFLLAHHDASAALLHLFCVFRSLCLVHAIASRLSCFPHVRICLVPPFLLFSVGDIHRPVFKFFFAFSGSQRTSGASRNHKRHPLLQLLCARFFFSFPFFTFPELYFLWPASQMLIIVQK